MSIISTSTATASIRMARFLSPIQNSLLNNNQTREMRIFPETPEIKVKNYPARCKLPIVPKVPSVILETVAKPYRGTKELYRMMGEEKVHNKLILGNSFIFLSSSLKNYTYSHSSFLGQYGIVAIHGGCLRHGTFEFMRNYINRFTEPNKCFAFYRVDAPYKPITKHGKGKKMGGGKGSISHYVTPIKAGRVILEVGGELLWEEVQPWLSRVAQRLPFEAIAVSKELMDRLDAKENRLIETNENPYTFEWLVRNNILDCHQFVSQRDKKWFGRFVYRDRELNKKWNLVRESKYKHR